MMLKTLDSLLYWNPILKKKTQPWSRNLQTLMRCMSFKHTSRKAYHNQKVQCEQTTLHSASFLHCKGEQSLEASCLCQVSFERLQGTRPNLGRFYVCRELQFLIILLNDVIIVKKFEYSFC